MGDKKHFPSPEERARLVTLFTESDMSVTTFCEKHGLPKTTFYRWLKTYKQNGIEGLTSKNDSVFKSIAPELTSEAELRKEILRLRIENERLKKNYMVRTDPDGKTEYIRLKAKNTKS